MDFPLPDPYRERHWPQATRDLLMIDGIRTFLRETGAPHLVNLPNGLHVTIGRDAWLKERLGHAMIFSTDYSALPYWTSGVWVGITALIRSEKGRDYFFVNPDDAFEFKMRWR